MSLEKGDHCFWLGEIIAGFAEKMVLGLTRVLPVVGTEQFKHCGLLLGLN